MSGQGPEAEVLGTCEICGGAEAAASNYRACCPRATVGDEPDDGDVEAEAMHEIESARAGMLCYRAGYARLKAQGNARPASAIPLSRAQYLVRNAELADGSDAALRQRKLCARALAAEPVEPAGAPVALRDAAQQVLDLPNCNGGYFGCDHCEARRGLQAALDDEAAKTRRLAELSRIPGPAEGQPLLAPPAARKGDAP